VVDSSSGRTLGVLAVGQGIRVLMVAGSWYTSG